MACRPVLATMALGGVALAAIGPGAAAQRPRYTLAATQSCLMSLPNSVPGLPPARPPVPPALFVFPLAHDAYSTWGFAAHQRRRPHKQLGVWSGDGDYEGVILSFFRSGSAARSSLESVAGLYGGKLIRNVIATWDQQARPSRSVRTMVFRCLRSEVVGAPTISPRPASLATFAGRWGGHDRGLSVTSTGRGLEFGNASCCERVYRMTFRILSVSGTLTRAAAVYRVTSFKRYERGVRRLHAGELGKLRLRNGIVTNTLTRDFFCSDPAWSATGACGA